MEHGLWQDKLERQLEWVLSASPFYRSKFSGIADPAGAFASLPFTAKGEVLLDQQQCPPFGSYACVDVRRIRRVHKTSGTTQRPVLIALTEKDIGTTVRIGAACFAASGLSSADMVVHCLNYNLWAGGVTDHQSLEATGAAVVPFGVGNSKALIELIRWLEPTAIHCTPSYLAKLETVLENEFAGLSPRRLGLRLGLFGGESGLQHPAFRTAIQTAWGLKAMNANYGMADVLSMFGAECSLQDGLHFMADGVLLPELINIDSLDPVPIAAGASGELVLTHLEKEAQPLVRFRTNDIIRILADDPCGCGRTGFRFEVLGRSDDMIVIKGVNVFIGAVDRIVAGFLEDVTGIYRILVNRTDPVDRMVLQLERRREAGPGGEDLVRRLGRALNETLGLTPEIQCVAEGTLPRTEGKSQKLSRSL